MPSKFQKDPSITF